MKKKKVMKPLTPMITLRLLLIVPWTKAIFPLPIPQQKFHPNIQIGAQITKIKMRTNPLQEVLPGLKGTVSYREVSYKGVSYKTILSVLCLSEIGMRILFTWVLRNLVVVIACSI